MDSTFVGLKYKPFDYSGTWIVSINEWNLKVREEIKRVKNLKSENSHWIVNNCPDKSVDRLIWKDDALPRINGVGKVMIDILKKKKITILSHLHNLSVSHVTELVNSSISRKLLERVITKAQTI